MSITPYISSPPPEQLETLDDFREYVRWANEQFAELEDAFNASFQVDWKPLTLQNSWVQYPSGGPYTYNAPEYAIDGFGRVHLRGLISSGTITGGTVIATLPEGFCPQERELIHILSWPVGSADSHLTVQPHDDINPGDIQIYGCNNTWLSLDNISFSANRIQT